MKPAAEVLCVSCLTPTDASAADRAGLCAKCAAEYERDMAAIARAEEEADARRVNVPEPRY